MSLKENLVTHPDEEEDTSEDMEIEVDQLSDDTKSSSSDSAAKSKMMKFMGIILIITILLLVVLFILSYASPKTYTYEEIEEVLKKAAVSYFKDHPESLPQNEGSIIEIDSSNLVAEGKMKELSEYVKDDVTCTGTVQVELAGSKYLYTPYLNCGETYATVELYKKIIDNGVVSSGYGLYANRGSYVYKGEEVNNYVKLDNNLWRIVKITPNNNIVLISNELVGYGNTWDDRYNENKTYEAGINQYSLSRIHDYLDKIYGHPSKAEEDRENILSAEDKTKLVSFDLCVGKRSQKSEGKDNAIECSQKMRNQKIGLLTVADYMNASLDPNCKTTVSKTCENYNYLAQVNSWWLITADKDDNSQVYEISQSGKIVSQPASTYTGVRPVVYLNSRVLYKGGKGTLKKPYNLSEISEDEKKK
ncbi:MAG: hypothetical protein IJI58_01665 [Bacilli bacterium]|nr:hypothetical protein [Bacilli bacterium]